MNFDDCLKKTNQHESDNISAKEAYEAGMQSVQVGGDNFIDIGEYWELVRINRKRQELIRKLNDEIAILRERKKHYKKLYKHSIKETSNA